MISERNQEERLKKQNINIKTKYKSGEKILERNTDNSKNDNIINGIRLEKTYYKNGLSLKKENIFDSRILYTYVFENEDITCINCGMHGSAQEFSKGCPYCHTNYNIDYVNKELGNKHYYDLIIKDKSYITKTLIIDFIFSFIITFLYLVPNSRTFYLFDLLKILLGTIAISLIMFSIFYYLDAVILLPSLKNKKEKENQKQREFWNRMQKLGVDKNKFFNNLNYNLRCLYYSEKYLDVIDYDIIDYESFSDMYVEETLFVKVSLAIRIVRIKNDKIVSQVKSNTFYLKKTELTKELEGEINCIKCPNCGASVDATKNKCPYCGTEYNYLQEWYLQEEIPKIS